MNPHLIFVLRRRLLILLVLPVVMVGAVLLLTPQPKAQPTRYTTKAYLAGNPSVVGTVDVEQAALELKQDDVSRVAAKALGMSSDDPKAFARPLKVKVQRESLSLEVSATNPDREWVAAYVNAFAQAFVDVRSLQATQTRDAEIQTLEASRDAAQVELNQFLQDNAQILAQPEQDPTVVSRRSVLSERLTAAEGALRAAKDQPLVTAYELKGLDPVTKVAPAKLQLPSSRPIRAMMAFILGVLSAIGITAMIERLNPRVDTVTGAEGIVGAPVLAQVPVMKGKRKATIERATLVDFSGPFAESFRATRSHLDFLGTVEKLDRPPCVMVVSSAPSEGKTTTSAFLALSYAEVGRDVVVVGADFRRPSVHNLFDVPRSPGLSSRLFGDEEDNAAAVASIVKRDPATGVRVIPSGPGTDRVTGLLGDLALVTEAGLQTGCTVILDTAPVMVANDALDYLPLVDWVVVVVRLGSTTQRSLRQTIQTLQLNEANIAGCVIVGSLEASDAKRYYYSYYNVDEDRQARGPKDPVPGEDRGFPRAVTLDRAASVDVEDEQAHPAEGRPSRG